MNTRIAALIKQCSEFDYRSGTNDFDKELFALLVVNEARLVLNKAAFDLGNTPESRAILQASTSVAEHFGA